MSENHVPPTDWPAPASPTGPQVLPPQMRFFQVNLPLFRRQSDYELAAAILEQSSKSFKQQLPKSEFYVLFYYPAMEDRDTRLMKLLDNAGVKYLPPGLSIENHQHLRYPDGHPTPAENAVVAQSLVDRLNLASHHSMYLLGAPGTARSPDGRGIAGIFYDEKLP